MSRSRLAETLHALSTGFEDLDVRWYVFGAQAAILYGVARATADIDVTVEPGTRPTSEIADALVGRGFRLRIADPTFVRQTRVLPIVHETGVPVDVVLAGPGLEEQFFERVVQKTVGGISIPVASAPDLIVMKILAGRPKDLEDIKGILSTHADIDVTIIRRTLRLLEGILDQSDLLPTFDRLWRGRRRRSTSKR